MSRVGNHKYHLPGGLFSGSHDRRSCSRSCRMRRGSNRCRGLARLGVCVAVTAVARPVGVARRYGSAALLDEGVGSVGVVIAIHVESATGAGQTLTARRARLAVVEIAGSAGTGRTRRAGSPAAPAVGVAGGKRHASAATSRQASGTAGAVGAIPAHTLTAALASATIPN